LPRGDWIRKNPVPHDVSGIPDLTRAGQRRDAAFLRDWITDPTAIDDFSNMPAFGEQLTEAQMDAIVNYLAARK
jgi:mono/diheme cytochrome c family protein